MYLCRLDSAHVKAPDVGYVLAGIAIQEAD